VTIYLIILFIIRLMTLLSPTFILMWTGGVNGVNEGGDNNWGQLVARMTYRTCGCEVNSPHNRTWTARAVNVWIELVPRMTHHTCGCAVN
jgi:hypothetical protein